MTIPFLNLFRRQPKAEPAPPSTSQPARPVEKPSSDRLSKTVLPSASRNAAPPDPFHAGANCTLQANGNGGAPAAPRTISFEPTPPKKQAAQYPPALAIALEPKVERSIFLALGDIAPQMPSGWMKPLSQDDAPRRILLKAAELERGMADGRPSVSIASIYRQVPELFLREVDAGDIAQVRLPFSKVLEQFTKLQLRSDQFREQSVPQVETPFLKVTLEDNERFGTTTEAMQTSDLPEVRVEPATANTIAAAEPEAIAQEKLTAPIAQFPVKFPSQPMEKEASPAMPVLEAKPAAPAPTRIPFKIAPKGTDVPASKSVPASNGASVPSDQPASTAPTRIPFKITPSSDEAAPKVEPWLTRESAGMRDPVTTTEDARRPKVEEQAPAEVIKISLPLRPILNALPPFQLTADIGSVSEEARIELPFSLVERQLASGRVSVTPEDFAAALPTEFRGLFTSKDIAAPVSLPLQEVLKNLPVASLRMRDDQEEQEKGSNFATPFSAKAEEDAKRFNVSGTPVSKPEPERAAPAAELPLPPVKMEAIPAKPETVPVPTVEADDARPAVVPFVLKPSKAAEAAKRSDLQALFETDEEVDAKGVVARLSGTAEIKSCVIMFADGLSLAGDFPGEFRAEGLCALAPSILQRMQDHLVETNLGALEALTLSSAKAEITFVMHANLCLAALHANGPLSPATRERLGRVVEELSHKYSNPV